MLSPGGHVTNVNGFDIIFTSDAACTQTLDHQIESYNSSTGQFLAWVRVPALSHASNTQFYLCYGNSGIGSSQENRPGVWDSNYKGVWHLPNGSTLSALDSTVNATNGSIVGAGAAVGQFDGAGALSGSSQYIDLGNPSSLQLTGDMTIEAWVKPTDYANYNGILEKTTGGMPAPFDFYLHQTTGIPNLFRGNGSVFGYVVANAAPSTGVWSSIAVTMSGSNVAHYLNGSGNGGGTLSTTIGDAGTHAYIATRADLYPMFKGGLDEVRVSNIARSADWLAAEYNNQAAANTFYTLACEGACGADFTLNSLSMTVTAGAGSNAPATVTITPINGFSSPVSFTAGSLPTGLTLTFSPNPAYGTTSAYVTAAANLSGQYTLNYTATSGVLTHPGTISVTVTANNAAPTVLQPTLPPPVPPGTQQTFTFGFSDANGTNSIQMAEVSFATALGGIPACTITYQSNGFYLTNDSGGGLLGRIGPGSGQTLSNSSCTVTNPSISSVGNQLTLTLPITFSPSFTTTPNVYEYVADVNGLSSGWLWVGTWDPNGPVGNCFTLTYGGVNNNPNDTGAYLAYYSNAVRLSGNEIWMYSYTVDSGPNAGLLLNHVTGYAYRNGALISTSNGVSSSYGGSIQVNFYTVLYSNGTYYLGTFQVGHPGRQMNAHWGTSPVCEQLGYPLQGFYNIGYDYSNAYLALKPTIAGPNRHRQHSGTSAARRQSTDTRRKSHCTAIRTGRGLCIGP